MGPTIPLGDVQIGAYNGEVQLWPGSMDLSLSLTEIALRLGVSLVMGALIGWEREARNKPAGLKTLALVSLGAASFTLITIELYQSVLAINPNANTDPTRLVQGIIGGIGFLGAGAIIQAKGSVVGVTTAASIWVVGAIGIACGGGHFSLALLTLILALLILIPMNFVEKKVRKNSHGQE